MRKGVKSCRVSAVTVRRCIPWDQREGVLEPECRMLLRLKPRRALVLRGHLIFNSNPDFRFSAALASSAFKPSALAAAALPVLRRAWHVDSLFPLPRLLRHQGRRDVLPLVRPALRLQRRRLRLPLPRRHERQPLPAGGLGVVERLSVEHVGGLREHPRREHLPATGVATAGSPAAATAPSAAATISAATNATTISAALSPAASATLCRPK